MLLLLLLAAAASARVVLYGSPRAVTGGSLGDRAAATALCAESPPLACARLGALVSYLGDAAVDLLPDDGGAVVGPTGVPVAANWTMLWSGSIANSLYAARVVNYEFVLSGTYSNGQPARSCNEFTETLAQVSARAGRRSLRDAGWISRGQLACDVPAQVVCFCAVSNPTASPSAAPSAAPSLSAPSASPSRSPTRSPHSTSPSASPSRKPTNRPATTSSPTTASPTSAAPTNRPATTSSPTTASPTTAAPTSSPTDSPYVFLYQSAVSVNGLGVLQASTCDPTPAVCASPGGSFVCAGNGSGAGWLSSPAVAPTSTLAVYGPVGTTPAGLVASSYHTFLTVPGIYGVTYGQPRFVGLLGTYWWGCEGNEYERSYYGNPGTSCEGWTTNRIDLTGNAVSEYWGQAFNGQECSTLRKIICACVADATTAPTHLPSKSPSASPSRAPSSASPSRAPSKSPSASPTRRPTNRPTTTSSPTTTAPTHLPSKSPSASPTPPSRAPSKSPSASPSRKPSASPTQAPTIVLFAGPDSVPADFLLAPSTANSVCAPAAPAACEVSSVSAVFCTPTANMATLVSGMGYSPSMRVTAAGPSGPVISPSVPTFMANGAPSPLQSYGLPAFNYWTGCGTNGQVNAPSTCSNWTTTSAPAAGIYGSTVSSGGTIWQTSSDACSFSTCCNGVLCMCVYPTPTAAPTNLPTSLPTSASPTGPTAPTTTSSPTTAQPTIQTTVQLFLSASAAPGAFLAAPSTAHTTCAPAAPASCLSPSISAVYCAPSPAPTGVDMASLVSALGYSPSLPVYVGANLASPSVPSLMATGPPSPLSNLGLANFYYWTGCDEAGQYAGPASESTCFAWTATSGLAHGTVGDTPTAPMWFDGVAPCNNVNIRALCMCVYATPTAAPTNLPSASPTHFPGSG